MEKRKEFNQKMEKIYEKAEENSDWKDDAEGFIFPCGRCTGCVGGKNYYEKINRIGEHFAFAENACYVLQLVRKEEDMTTTIAYYKNGVWKKGDEIDYRDVFWLMTEAVREMKQWQQKKTKEIENAVKELDKELN